MVFVIDYDGSWLACIEANHIIRYIWVARYFERVFNLTVVWLNRECWELVVLRWADEIFLIF